MQKVHKTPGPSPTFCVFLPLMQLRGQSLASWSVSSASSRSGSLALLRLHGDAHEFGRCDMAVTGPILVQEPHAPTTASEANLILERADGLATEGIQQAP